MSILVEANASKAASTLMSFQRQLQTTSANVTTAEGNTARFGQVAEQAARRASTSFRVLGGQAAVTGAEVARIDGSAALASGSVAGLGSAAQSASSPLSDLTRTAIAASGAFVLWGAAKGAITQTIELMHATQQLSLITGMNIRQSSEWIEIMKVRGVQSTAVSRSFITLSRSIRTAQDATSKHGTAVDALSRKQGQQLSLLEQSGASHAKISALEKSQGIALDALKAKTDKSTAAFRELGVSQQTVNRGNVNQTILEIADGFQRMHDPARRAALAQQLFGRQSLALIPILAQGRRGVEDALAAAQRYGAFLPNNVRQLRAAHEAQLNLNLAMDGLKIAFTRAVLPVLVSGARALLKFISQMRDGTGAGGSFARTISSAFNTIKSVVTTVVGALGGFGNTLRVVLALLAIRKITSFTGALLDMFKVLRTGSAGSLAGVGSELAGAEAQLTGFGSRLARVKSALGNVLSAGARGLQIAGIGTVIAQTVGSSVHGAIGKAIATIGTDASIGVGIGRVFGPAGMIAGALGGGLIGAVTTWTNQRAIAEGRAWADKFTSSLPGKLSQAARAGLRRAATVTPPSANTAASRFQNAAQRGVQVAQMLRFATDFGRQTGDQFAKGMAAVRHQTPQALLGSMLAVLRNVPQNVRRTGAAATAAWQDAAARQMLAYATGLERHGRLPRGAVNNLIVALRRQFGPGLTAYLASVGEQNQRAIAHSMNLAAAQANLGRSLNAFRVGWNRTWQFARSTNANILTNTARAMADLRPIIAHGTRDQRLAAMREYNLLAIQAARVWQYIANTATRMLRSVVSSVSRASASLGNSVLGVLGIHSRFHGVRGLGNLSLFKVPPFHPARDPATRSAPRSAAASSPSSRAAQRAAAATAPIAAAAAPTAAAAASYTPPVLPSQTVAAQIRMAELQNAVQVAQNAQNIAGQQKALNAELKLEKLWLREDKQRLAHITGILRSRGLSAARRSRLQQDRLAILQEIGNVAGQVGSTMSSLASLTGGGSTGSFDLAPGGGQVPMPTVYDVRHSIARIDHGRSQLAAHNHHNNNTFNIHVHHGEDVPKVEDAIERATGSTLHARLRSAGMRGT